MDISTKQTVAQHDRSGDKGVIEKAFQPGHEKLVSQGFDVYPLARISHMAKDEIEFLED